MKFCITCGARTGLGLRFCTSCGANLQPTTAPEDSAAPDSVFPHPAPPAAWPAAEVSLPEPGSDSVFAAPAAPAPWAARPDPWAVRPDPCVAGSVPVEPWAASEPAERRPDEFWDAPEEDDNRHRPLVIGAVVLAVLLVVGGGYVVVDHALLAEVSAASAQGSASALVPDPAGGSGLAGADDADVADEDDQDSDAGSSGQGGAAARPGGTDLLRPRSVTATCQAPPGVDAANAPVTYDAINVLDGVGSTAWRCPGAAVGQQLVFDFDRPVTLASVGVVPGYDKIDPVDGTDRFGENRSVTGVTWRFDDGAAHRQDIAVPTRAMAQSRLTTPVTTTRVALEITRTGNDGAIRDFTTISDVAFLGSE